MYEYDFTIPGQVSHVTKILREAGFEAWLVGGCVRDLYRGETPKDWDVTTNATPDEVIPLFEKTVHENDFGTVFVINEDEEQNSPYRSIEVTTYRKETTYTNNRHPDSIEFAKSLEEDLKRRDFTMNALAYDDYKRQLNDTFGGINDINDKVVRTVGNPHERFQEDALRMLRSVRFSAQFGFRVSRETHDAIDNHAERLQNISEERIRDEFCKLVDSPYPEPGMTVSRETKLLQQFLPEMLEGYGVEQDRDHVYDVWKHLLKACQYAAEKEYLFHVKLAALFHDIGKPRTKGYDKENKVHTFYGHEVVGAKMANGIMKRLKFSNEVREKVRKLVRWHMFFVDTEEITLSAVRRMVQNVGEELIWDLMKLRRCDRIGMGRPKESPYKLRKYEAMVEEAVRDPVSVKQLKIDGDYMINTLHMKPGPRMGHILHALLEEVLDDPSKNTLEYLEKRTKELDELSDEEIEALGKQGKQKQEEIEEQEVQKIRSKYKVR